VWLTAFYPNLNDTGALLTAIRLTFGTAMVAIIVVAYTSIKRRDIARHRAWMIRAYALALGVSTQIFTLGFGQAIVGVTKLSTALLVGAGWVINLAIAEWAIRRRFRRPPGRRAGAEGANGATGRGDHRHAAGQRAVRSLRLRRPAGRAAANGCYAAPPRLA
jgi:hypothetical protein